MPPWLSPAGKDLPQHPHLLDESERFKTCLLFASFAWWSASQPDVESNPMPSGICPKGPLTLCYECSCPLPYQLHHTEQLHLAVGVAWLEMPWSFTPSPKATKDRVMWRHQSPTSLPRGGADSGALRAPKIPEVLYQGYTSPGKHILASFLLPWSAFFTLLLTFPLSFLNELFTWKSLSQALFLENAT